MQVKDLMTRDVVSVCSDDPVSNALSKMKKHSVHQLPVIDDNEIKGILLLKKIITKDIDPSTTKSGSFAISAPSLQQDEDIEDATRKILNSGLRAMPVMNKGSVVGIISETDLLRLVKDDYKISKIMTRCDYLTIDDDIGKARKLMAYKNISRIPIMDKGDVVGVVGTMDLIDAALKAKQPLAAHAKMKEKGFKGPVPVDKIKLKTIMKSPAIINKDSPIKNVAELLVKEREVIVRDDNELCIITPKDIIELLIKPERGVYVHISNLGDIDSLTASKIDQSVTEFIQKIGRLIKDIQPLYIHIERHEKLGKTKYSVRTRFFTPLGLFVSKAWGWDLVTITQDAMNKLEKEVLKKYDKVRDKKKGVKS